jgi:hypothetical protein
MGLEKAIKSGKEHRKPYSGSKAFDCSCRNHGGCPWCEENRKIKYIRKEKIMLDKLAEWLYNTDSEGQEE